MGASADANRFTPLDHALHDGEDYELLYTASLPKMPNGKLWPGKCVGQTTENPDILLIRNESIEELKPRGWEHSL